MHQPGILQNQLSWLQGWEGWEGRGHIWANGWVPGETKGEKEKGAPKAERTITLMGGVQKASQKKGGWQQDSQCFRGIVIRRTVDGQLINLNIT